MSMFANAIAVHSSAAQAVQELQKAAIRAVVVPRENWCLVLAADEDQARVASLFAESWIYHYAEDHGLWVTGYQAGQSILELDFSALWNDDSAEDLLDEDGFYPDGSPGPQLALNTSSQSVQQARQQGFITEEQASWLQLALLGSGPPNTEWDLEEHQQNDQTPWDQWPFLFPELARQLGFPIAASWNAETLEHLSEEAVENAILVE